MSGGVQRDFNELLARLQSGGSINCRDCSDFLMAYLENEVSADIRARFEQHLSACCSCRCYVDTYRQTVQLAQQACCPKANPQLGKMPAELVNAILSALGRQQ